jgi:hypothetical protein
MSYLRGPLTRLEIAKLAGERPAGTAASGPAAGADAGIAGAAAAPGRSGSPAGAAAAGTEVPAQGVAGAAPTAAPAAPAAGRPLLPPAIEERFLPLRGRPGSDLLYRPGLAGFARVHYADAKAGVEQVEEVALFTLLAAETAPDWYTAEALAAPRADLERAPAGEAAFAPLPPAAAEPRSFDGWAKALGDALYRSRRLDLWKSPALGLASRPGESEREFRIRLAEAAREKRDEEVEALRDRYARRLESLEERRRRAAERVERERQQAQHQKLDTVFSVGATVLGAFLGRRRLGMSTIGRATTAARGFGRSLKEGQDVDRAEADLQEAGAARAALEAELKADQEALAARFSPDALALETAAIKPRRADVVVTGVALAWAPYRKAPGGGVEPGWG